MTLEQIKYLRLERQGLIEAVNASAYEDLFRNMSPVPTKFWIEPGTPPEIEQRCDFNDRDANDFARRMRAIVKGRFQGGNVGYVYQDEMPLFAAVYRKPINRFTEVEQTILTLLHNEGPMNLKMMKEITGILNKDLSKAAQHLQKAFMLFEDQVDKENDRAWYLLEDEFDELDFNKFSELEAVQEALRRFFFMNVMADASMIKSFTKLTNKVITRALNNMIEESSLIPLDIAGNKGYMLTLDVEEAEKVVTPVPDLLLLLDNNDYLVKSNEMILKQRFGKSDYKTLGYIYKQGEFVGRLLGYFRFGPDDLEDVELDVEKAKQEAWKERVLALIEEAYEGQGNVLKRYCSEEL